MSMTFNIHLRPHIHGKFGFNLAWVKILVPMGPILALMMTQMLVICYKIITFHPVVGSVITLEKMHMYKLCNNTVFVCSFMVTYRTTIMNHSMRALSASYLGHLTVHIADPNGCWHYFSELLRILPILTSTQELNDLEEGQDRTLDPLGEQPSII